MFTLLLPCDIHLILGNLEIMPYVQWSVIQQLIYLKGKYYI